MFKYFYSFFPFSKISLLYIHLRHFVSDYSWRWKEVGIMPNCRKGQLKFRILNTYQFFARSVLNPKRKLFSFYPRPQFAFMPLPIDEFHTNNNHSGIKTQKMSLWTEIMSHHRLRNRLLVINIMKSSHSGQLPVQNNVG